MNHFETGFIKRAMEHGATKEEAEKLLKKEENRKINDGSGYKRVGMMGGALLGHGFGKIISKGLLGGHPKAFTGVDLAFSALGAMSGHRVGGHLYNHLEQSKSKE